ncbi:HD family phosphohydrolase [Pontiella sulfatireligans]|uniref:Cyclic-di-AMP phosphodiesterase PgpH n=1 Tax=Pontiella sulfatireligans TaxID=2750658 RepID=A0A6C2UIY0_9BACT|nr:HDIG domain-containing metalloprotein [Pontiella sulfatireligans]VGO20175.1 Cyclic-di-AMP phosphodiesterase PgpH [Pontiella sulfatireligans]
MKSKLFKKKQKGIAERKTETKHSVEVPYKAVGLGLLLWLFTTWLFFGHGMVRHIDLAEGQQAPSTVVAAVDFDCENIQSTDFSRTEAAKAVPPVFRINPFPAQRASKMMETLFDRLKQLSIAPTNQQQMIVSSMNDLLLGTSIETTSLINVFPTNTIQQTQKILVENITAVMGTGILSEEYRHTWFLNAPDNQLTITSGELPERTIPFKDTLSTRQAINAVASKIESKPQRKLLERLLPILVVDNLTYDETATENLRKQATDAVLPVIQQYMEGTPLVRAGDTATQQTLLLLQHHEQRVIEEQELLEQILEIVGNGLLLLAGLIASAVILRVVEPCLIRQPSRILLLVILSLTTLGFARLMLYLSAQYSLIPAGMLMYLVPHALAVLLAGILLGGSAAICLGFWTSFATAVLFDNAFTVFALGMLITITAASTARKVHRRSSLFRAGLWVCAVKLLYVLVVAILSPAATSVLVGQASAALLSGMLSTIFALLLIPFFERAFKITTDITLLELSDMGHPLLQKMAIQAPGTYHHSLMVATLAQNAAEAIGANSLLVRVCAYYHDIGKMAKPEFFTENIQHKENPHDELSPHMSALVISSHVKEGLTLAKRHKLPQPVLDAIEQHHGNGLISYFYHKAKTQSPDSNGSPDTINDSDFRYGGAPAVTPEMAILSLADASEAASRSIEKPTPQKIANMMNDIFSTKIRDGQMDYAALTMAQINTIKQSFIFSLSNMLHGRIPYPKDNDNKYSQSAEKSSGSAAKAPKAS